MKLPVIITRTWPRTSYSFPRWVKWVKMIRCYKMVTSIRMRLDSNNPRLYTLPCKGTEHSYSFSSRLGKCVDSVQPLLSARIQLTRMEWISQWELKLWLSNRRFSPRNAILDWNVVLLTRMKSRRLVSRCSLLTLMPSSSSSCSLWPNARIKTRLRWRVNDLTRTITVHSRCSLNNHRIMQAPNFSAKSIKRLLPKTPISSSPQLTF